MDSLFDRLNRVPFLLFAALYCGYLGFDYYNWLNGADSELGRRKAAIVSAKADLEAQKKKLANAEEFFKNLESLRSRILQLTAQLDSTRTTLSADIDIANFVRMVTHEANKLKISIKGIKPNAEAKKDYYVEVPFTVSLRGAFVQLLVFFDRVAKFQQVIRISDFQMKPSGNTFTKYVELDCTAKLVAYKYLGTQADEVNAKADHKALESQPDPKGQDKNKQKGGR